MVQDATHDTFPYDLVICLAILWRWYMRALGFRGGDAVCKALTFNDDKRGLVNNGQIGSNAAVKMATSAPEQRSLTETYWNMK